MLDAVAWAEAEELVRDADRRRSWCRTACTADGRPTSAACRPWSTSTAPPTLLGRRGRARARRGGPRRDHAEPRRRGLRAGTSTRVPGAMGRLGTRTPGGPTYDLHQGDLRVDERAISIGAKVLAGGRARAPMVTDCDNACCWTVPAAPCAPGSGRPRRIGCPHHVPVSRRCTLIRGGILRRFSKIAAVARRSARWRCAGAAAAAAAAGARSAAERRLRASAEGDGPKIGVAYDVGGRGDQSFNDSAYAGAARRPSRSSTSPASRPRPTPARTTTRPARSGFASSPTRGYDPIIGDRLRSTPRPSPRSPPEFPEINFAVDRRLQQPTLRQDAAREHRRPRRSPSSRAPSSSAWPQR